MGNGYLALLIQNGKLPLAHEKPPKAGAGKLSSLMLGLQKAFDYSGKVLTLYGQLGWLHTRNRRYDNITEEHWR